MRIGNKHSTRTMTLIEVMMVLAVLMLLGALLLPDLWRSRYRSSRVGCTNQLKQVGLAFRIWALDQMDRYPMCVSTNEGGSMEFVGQPGQAFQHFRVMSNELPEL